MGYVSKSIILKSGFIIMHSGRLALRGSKETANLACPVDSKPYFSFKTSEFEALTPLAVFDG